MRMLDLVAWIASAITLATFFMKTMIPLRVLAIAGNLFGIGYGLFGGGVHAVITNSVLLPFNIYRLVEMRRLVENVSTAADCELSLEWLKPFMKGREYPKGHVIFRKGERADYLYFLAKGQIRLMEFEHVLEPGHLFGEIGFFAPGQIRSLTAVCAGDCEVYAISESALKQLYYQNPEFGFYLVRLIARRLTLNIQRVEERAKAATAGAADPVQRAS